MESAEFNCLRSFRVASYAQIKKRMMAKLEEEGRKEEGPKPFHQQQSGVQKVKPCDFDERGRLRG